MIAELVVSDEIVVGFFSAVVIGLAGAVGVLWRKLERERDKRSGE